MRLALNSQQSEIRRKWGVESSVNDWVNQEVTPYCKGKSSPGS